MEVRAPDYFGEFRCLAGRCPHSCCIGWEVEVDDASAAYYAKVPGPLGGELRAALTRDGEGALCFPLNGDRCPFLDEENLCRLHRELGEAHTSETCRSHPRFLEDYGPIREISLAASCPAANALLLGSDRVLTFPVTRQPDPGEPGDAWLEPLLAIRDRCLALLSDRSRPLGIRLARLLRLCLEAQSLLDEDRAEALPALAAAELPDLPGRSAGPGLFPAGLRLLGTLELLEPGWGETLSAAETAPAASVPEPSLERIAAYFTFRWLLKAVNDGDLLSRAQLVTFATLTVERLAGVSGLGEALRCFSREIEHSEENREKLMASFRRGEPELARFFRELLENQGTAV